MNRESQAQGNKELASGTRMLGFVYVIVNIQIYTQVISFLSIHKRMGRAEHFTLNHIGLASNI